MDANVGRSRPIFLSHAAADKILADHFEKLLTKVLNITSDDIFCTSLEGQGVKKGDNFVESIRGQVTGAKAVVALISPAYLDSAFCMAELGAAWALSTYRLPIVVPPNDFKVMDATLLGIAGIKLDDQDQLTQALEELCAEVDLAVPAMHQRNRGLRDFFREWPAIQSELKGPSRIAVSVHYDVLKARDTALEERDAAEADLRKAEAEIAELRKAKNADDVARITAQFANSNWEDDFDNALNEIRKLYPELGGQEIVRLIILDALGNYVPIDQNEYQEQARRAIELNVCDPYGAWNRAHPEVKRLFALVRKVRSIVLEDETASATLAARGQRNDPDYIRFWEEHLR